jgi:hypothetical protein
MACHYLPYTLAACNTDALCDSKDLVLSRLSEGITMPDPGDSQQMAVGGCYMHYIVHIILLLLLLFFFGRK